MKTKQAENLLFINLLIEAYNLPESMAKGVWYQHSTALTSHIYALCCQLNGLSHEGCNFQGEVQQELNGHYTSTLLICETLTRTRLSGASIPGTQTGKE